MRLSIGFFVCLFSSATPAQVVKLNDPLAREDIETVHAYRISPDSSSVVFAGDLGAGVELGLVPLDGSLPPRALGSAAAGGELEAFELAPDGNRVVFSARHAGGVRRLYSLALPGGAPLLLSAAGSVEASYSFKASFRLAADGQRAVYRSQDLNALFSVALDGSSAPARLDAPLLLGPAEQDFVLTSDGARVLFRAERDTSGSTDLYTVPSDGSAPALRLNPTRPGGDVREFVVSSDGRGVAYAADQATEDQFELYVAPSDGSAAPVKRSGTLVSGASVSRIAFASSSDRLIYFVDSADPGPDSGLWSVSGVAGGVPVRLSPTTGGEWVYSAEIDPLGRHVVFRLARGVGHGFELRSYALPSDGSLPRREFLLPGTPGILRSSGHVLFPWTGTLSSARIEGGAGVRLDDSPAGALLGGTFFPLADDTLVYSALAHATRAWGIYRVPIDGSASPTRLGPTLPSGLEPTELTLTPDARRLVFLAGNQLYSLPIAGGATIRLSRSGGGPTIGDVTAFDLSPDGSTVLYVAQEGASRTPELLSAPSDGSAGSLRLVEAHVAPNEARNLSFTPDGSRAVFAFDGRLFVVEPGERHSVRAIAAPSSPEFFLFPDGERVLYDILGGAYGPLGVVSLDGLTPPQILDLPGYTSDFQISPDGTHLAYHSVGAGMRLRSLALDGPGLPQDVAEDIGAFAFIPDGTRLVYIDAALRRLRVRVRDASSPALDLSGAGTGTVQLFRVHPDGQRVVYVKRASGTESLWCVRLDGTDRLQLDGPFAPFDDESFLEFVPGTSELVYTLTPVGDPLVRLVSAALDGSRAPRLLHSGSESVIPVLRGAAVRFSADRVVFLTGSTHGPGAREVRSAWLGGGVPSVLLGAAKSGRTLARTLELTRSGAVFADEAPVSTPLTPLTELFLAPLDGSAPARVLNAPLLPNRAVRDFRVTADGWRVVYLADQDEDDVDELYSVFLGPHRPRSFGR